MISPCKCTKPLFFHIHNPFLPENEMKKLSEHDFYSESGTSAPCLLFLLQKLPEQVLQHPINPGQLCSFPLCSQSMTALASVADKSSPDCLDSAIKLIHTCSMKLGVFFLLLKKKKRERQVFMLFWRIKY